MNKILKVILNHPIYAFSLLSLLLGGLFIYRYLPWAIPAAIYVYGIYFILILVGFFLHRFNVPFRVPLEWILVVCYFGFFIFITNVVGDDIYLHGYNRAFTGNKTSFIIVFDVEGAASLDENTFFNNRFYIPKDGILLTSSPFFKKFAYSVLREHDNLSLESTGSCQCYGVDNYKFDFVSTTFSPESKSEHNHVWEDSIKDKICDKLKNLEFRTTLKAGYENGDYLDQEEVTVRGWELTKLPKGISELKNLKYLDLSTIYLKKIPEEIKSLKKLEKLVLYNNAIDTIPEWIGTMDNLKYIDLTFNELESIPELVFTIPNLQYLDIRDNPLGSSNTPKMIKLLEEKGVKVIYK